MRMRLSLTKNIGINGMTMMRWRGEKNIYREFLVGEKKEDRIEMR